MDGFLTIEDPSSVALRRVEAALSSPYDRAAESTFDHSAGAVVGHSVNMLTAEPYHSEHDGCPARYVRTGRPWNKKVLSNVVWSLVTKSAAAMSAQFSVMIIGIGREATGRTSLPPAGRITPSGESPDAFP